MVFSSVPSAEEGGEFIVKMIDIEDLQVEPLSKMKRNLVGKLDSGGDFWGPKVKEIIQKPLGI